jgi:AraC family transcriptional regulator
MLANIAALSMFYYQRLFTRLVKKPVREYIKLRRLARSCKSLENKFHHTADIAIEYGFGSRETFSRAFKATYGLSPSEYRDKIIGLNNFDKPNLLLNYVMVDEGVPLITEGIVLEYNRKTLDKPINFLGVKDLWRFKPGKMLGERPGVSEPSAIWDRFFNELCNIPCIPHGRRVGVSYHGGAPEGYSTYFVGAEVDSHAANSIDTRFASWQLPTREYTYSFAR